MMVAALDPAKLIDTGRYPIADPEAPAFAKAVAAAHASFDRDGLALLAGFLTPNACRTMTAEAEAALPRAHRRDTAFSVYRDHAKDRPPEGHPALKSSPFCQWVIATDLLSEQGALRRLFHWEPLTRFVGALVGETLYCTADPLAACNVTVMREGDQHGWHFDSNDFVVSLLLQAPEAGGRFEVRPGARSERGIEHDVVASALGGSDPEVKRPPLEEGTLSIFRGERALHRVSPVEGRRHRFIALFSYDRQPGMMFSHAVRMGAFGRVA